jgi:hypothetical protein
VSEDSVSEESVSEDIEEDERGEIVNFHQKEGR